MHQIVVRRGHGIVLTEAPDPQPGPHEVAIDVGHSYISAGTELVSVRRAREAEPGGTDFATGYSQSGVVTAVGDQVTRIRPGQRVAAIGQGAFHATKTVVGQNLVTPIPDEVSGVDAATAAMFCFAIEAVHKSAVGLGQKVVVLGAGMMGQFASRLYDLAGADVAVLDGLALRRDALSTSVLGTGVDDDGWREVESWAKPYGVEHVCIGFGGDATDAIQRIKPLMITAPDGVPHGRMVFPGGAEIHLMMASAMGNIELLSSAKAGPGYRDPGYEAGSDYPLAYVDRTTRRNVETMMWLLRTGRLDMTGMITHQYDFADAPRAYTDLEERPGEILSAVLRHD